MRHFNYESNWWVFHHSKLNFTRRIKYMLLEEVDYIEVEADVVGSVSFEIVESDLLRPDLPTVQVYSA